MLRFWVAKCILGVQAIGYTKTQEARHMPTEQIIPGSDFAVEYNLRKPTNLPKLTREQLNALAKEHGLELEDEK